MSAIKKNLAVPGIAVFFTLGVLAVSFAAPESSPVRSPDSVAIHKTLGDLESQADAGTLRTGEIIEGKGLPVSSQPQAGKDPDANTELQYPPPGLSLIAVFIPKVSLQILYSVLIL